MNDFITLHKEEASKNMDIRKEILKAMANAGWQFRDSGTLCPIDVNVLEIRSCTAGIPPFCFTRGEEDWSWAAFEVNSRHLVCGQNSMHCIDLAAELLGDDALEALIKETFQLNEFGFRVEDILEKGKVNSKKLAEMMRMHGGPWVAYEIRTPQGDGIHRLYRYDRDKKIYHFMGQEDMIRLCRRAAPYVTPTDAAAIDFDIVTHPQTRVETSIYTEMVAVRGGKLLNLRTMETMDYDESTFVTGRLKARWDETPEDVARTYATAGGKKAKELLNSIEDPQDRKVFLGYLAYMLTPEFHLKKFLIIYGNSNCGKSTKIQAFVEGLCAEGMCTGFDPDDAFGGGDGARFGLEGLMDKRVGYCYEWGSYRLPDKGLRKLKSIVAGEVIEFDCKNEKRKSLKFPTKLIAASNVIPNFQDSGGAVYNRLIILDFSRDPFDPETSPSFIPWFDDEDFATVLLREAVMALNDPADNCWGEEGGKWYVQRLPEPSEKSKELRAKVRNESAKCIGVIAAMLTGGTEDTPVPQMLGQQWKSVENDYKDIYQQINGPMPKDITVEYLNSVLFATMIGGKLYQFHESGAFKIGGRKSYNRRNYLYEYSRNRETKADNIRKAGVWNLYAGEAHMDEDVFKKWLIDQGLADCIEECLEYVHEIEEETARLQREQNMEIEVG